MFCKINYEKKAEDSQKILNSEKRGKQMFQRFQGK